MATIVDGADALSDESLELLWVGAEPSMQSSAPDMVAAALSGADPNAAHALLFWLRDAIATGRQPAPEVKSYADTAFARFAAGGVTFGQAFGLERPSKRGAPPLRTGADRAIVGLIGYLHEQGFALGVSASGPSAFDVAAQLLKRKWGYARSASTLRDHWNKREK